MMRTSSRNVALLLYDEVDLLDVAALACVLTEAGRHYNWRPFKVFPATASGSVVETRHQVGLEGRCTLERCPDSEILLLPGGYGARARLDNAEMLRWISERGRTASAIVATGAGVLLAARAGLINGRQVAISAEHVELLGELDPSARRVVAPEGIVADEVLITADRSARALDAALELVARSIGVKHARKVAMGLGCGWVPSSALESALEVEHVRVSDLGALKPE